MLVGSPYGTHYGTRQVHEARELMGEAQIVAGPAVFLTSHHNGGPSCCTYSRILQAVIAMRRLRFEKLGCATPSFCLQISKIASLSTW